jgi:hypothetical protein
VPADPATAGDGLLRSVRRQYARRRRTRALVSAGGAVATAGTAAAVLLSVTVAGAPPALAAVTSALSRAAAESFRMNLVVTQRNTVPGQPIIQSPLNITGELDLKRNLGAETLSYGWRTRIVGGKAYTELPPRQAREYGTGGKPWTEEPLSASKPPYGSAAGQLAWDFDSDRPFNPQALLTAFAVHPRHGRSGQTIYTTDFTFSDFGIRFSVTPPPASQIDDDNGVSVQF